ncbi:Uncharacterised protein [Klebsiella pneumoniae subsp. rhinoscleromatis]|nr:Uncharacterised protein [Klebsiella pneumoniae subsp. rhinoscleromatis]
MLTIATFGLPGQHLANGFSAAKHKVKDPFRQPNLMDNLGKGDGIIGRKFAGLNDDGISSDQGRRQLAGDKKEREVPRQDPGGHPQRAFKDKDILPRGDRSARSHLRNGAPILPYSRDNPR